MGEKYGYTYNKRILNYADTDCNLFFTYNLCTCIRWVLVPIVGYWDILSGNNTMVSIKEET